MVTNVAVLLYLDFSSELSSLKIVKRVVVFIFMLLDEYQSLIMVT